MADIRAQSEQLSAHERRARIIAQLHRDAAGTAEYRSTRRREATKKIVEGLRWRKAKAWLLIGILFASGLACICALFGMVALAL
jgi:hypothetical protein